MQPPRTTRERLDWLRLLRCENVGPVTFVTLLARFGSAGRALDALPELARRGGARGRLRLASAEEAEREFARIEALGARLLALGESAYPAGLAATEGAPPLVIVQGDVGLLARPMLAIVGARNASAAGTKLARDFAAAIGQAGTVIVSGLARGIDTAAHEGALATGTVGVLAGGIDIVYPPEDGRLYDSMRRQGLLVSEMPPGTAPQARHFPRRNRLISGLARATLVVEAAERSGSLITARFALEQGRDVMALPGSPLDPRCRGSNRLIREGALLVQDPSDVLDALAGLPPLRLAEPEGYPVGSAPLPVDGEAEADRLRPILLEKLGPTPVEIDELIRQTGAPAALVVGLLLELELAGRLTRQPGQRVCLI